MKKLLLDTHAFIWLLSDQKRVEAKALKACRHPSNKLFVSVASAWEMQIKYQLGKLALPKPPQQLVEEQRKENQIKVLPIDLHHVAQIEFLPAHHGDPFDRMLMAQAISEKLTLVSADKKIELYADQVDLLWS